MLVIPAVDIRGKKAVRLQEGDYGRETVYYDDPIEAARRWLGEGAECLHVVDLDGAREGVPVNAEIVEAIVRESEVPVEAGGGIRDIESVDRYIGSGVDMVILGTGACSSEGFLEDAVGKYGGRIAASLDCRGGDAAVRGWTETMQKSVPELLGEFENIGVENLVFTDIKRDGLLTGVDINRVREIVDATSLRVTVAGGVGSVDDIIKLSSLDIRGVIVGKALYSGRVDLGEALKCLKS